MLIIFSGIRMNIHKGERNGKEAMKYMEKHF